MRLKTVQYTDGTTLEIWCKKMTIKELLELKENRKLSYTSLIEKAIATGEAYYDIAANRDN